MGWAMTETPNNLRDIMAKPPAPSEADKWFRHRIRLVPYLVAFAIFGFFALVMVLA